MRTLIYFVAIFLIASNALSTESKPKERTEHETYIWLEREGMFDPEVPTSEVHELLSNGMKHEDSKIVHCSISAIIWYSGITREARVNGVTPSLDRRLGELPGLYDLFVEMWEKGWKESDGIEPDVPAPPVERFINKTGCLAPDMDFIWTSLALPMAYLFPGDAKVYDIIWKDLPQSGPGSLLMGLFEGKFNNPKDQQYRIDFLTDPKTEQYWSKLAARSLGEFRSEDGLEALVQVLQKFDTVERGMEYPVPTLVIVEAMIKYETEASPYIDVMRKKLENAVTIGQREHDLRITLKERLVHFEETYAEEPEQPGL